MSAPVTVAPAILKLAELKVYLRLSRSTIYHLAATGALPKPVKLGKRASGWLKSDVDAWLSARAMQHMTNG